MRPAPRQAQGCEGARGARLCRPPKASTLAPRATRAGGSTMTPTDLPKEIVLADTATKLGDAARGGVIVTGSHGGRYAGYLTLKAHPRAVIPNDAGVGKDEAGLA